MQAEPTYEPCWDDQATYNDFCRAELSAFTDAELLAELEARYACRLERIKLALREVNHGSD